MLEKIQSALDRMSLIAVWIGGAAMLAIAFLVGLEVIIRKLFNVSLGGADEISGYIFAAATAWAYALVLRRKGNVRIDVVYRLLPKPAKLLLDIVSFFAIGVLIALIGWFGFKLTGSTLETGRISVTPLQTPLAIPQFIWIAGFGLALLMWMSVSVQVVKCLVHRNWSGVFELIGTEGSTADNDFDKAHTGSEG